MVSSLSYHSRSVSRVQYPQRLIGREMRDCPRQVKFLVICGDDQAELHLFSAMSKSVAHESPGQREVQVALIRIYLGEVFREMKVVTTVA